jgi:hypothetical protein
LTSNELWETLYKLNMEEYSKIGLTKLSNTFSCRSTGMFKFLVHIKESKHWFICLLHQAFSCCKLQLYITDKFKYVHLSTVHNQSGYNLSVLDPWFPHEYTKLYGFRESGRYPLYIKVKIRMIMFLNKLQLTSNELWEILLNKDQVPLKMYSELIITRSILGKFVQ